IALLLVGAHLQTNLVIDEQATQARKQAARDAVKPVTVQIVEGESIVRAGDMVTPDVREKLEALGELNTETDWYDVAGKGILAALIGLLFGVYVRQTQRDVWLRTRPLATIVGLAVLTVLLARLLASVSVDLLYGFPLAITALLVATLFSGNLALFVTVLLVVPISIVGQESIGIAVTLIMGAVAAIFAIGRGERSLNFVLAGLTVSVVSTAAALAFALTNFRATSLDQLLVTGAYSGINGALTAVLALGMYNLLGHIAGIVTPMQLMELAHPAQPLLRKLIREAPGTYYHSIAVGNLAESAAEAIGADALLLRVASYYHDIGKTVRPFFFTDNQSDRENVHNDIDPHTSAGIIADHVREGAVLARQAGLPRQVID
ncbi:MAG TPA: HDIG domain-containing protein, partial [Roseiflexaceae bacterium]|nr:HDIG domain-containing protein [Roseiflexaceae bacterium]